jgi:hypothetical protein
VAQLNAHTPGPWKTGREDMQSYTGDGETAFTNIYHQTLTDGEHLGRPLPLTIGRAEGENNKADAKLMAAAPDLVVELRRCIVMLRSLAGDIEDGIAPQLRHKVIAAIDNCTEPARAALAKAGV